MECIIKANVEKVLLIIIANMKWSSLESWSAWTMMSQRTPKHMYEVEYPFTEYANYTYDWALCGNLCKHQIVIILAYTYVTAEIIFNYCGTWYGTNQGGLKAMFTNLHLLDNNSNASDDNERPNQITNGEGVVDIDGLIFPSDHISTFHDVKVPQAQMSNAHME